MDDLFDARRTLGPGANWIALIGALAILGMAGAVVVDVLMRWIFNLKYIVAIPEHFYNI